MFFVIPFVIMIAGFWPAMVWHGEGGPTGTAWRWDVHSTIGCCIWWGFWVFGIACWLIGKKLDQREKRPAPGPSSGPPMRAMPPAPPPVQAPPVCVHANTTAVNETFGPLREPGKLVAWLCLDCGTQLDPGFRSAELQPDATWPPMRMRARP
jgi:hypothetical protein